MANYKTIREFYNSPIEKNMVQNKPTSTVGRPNGIYTIEPSQFKRVFKKEIRMRYEEKEHENTSAPDVFGPAFWFTLHNGASKYPIEASPIQAEKMKGFIKGIPVMLPCEKCSSHAQTYIESKDNELDDIVSGREKLFTFFWEFHNYVNRRYGKPEPTLEEAKMMFMGKARVASLKYTVN